MVRNVAASWQRREIVTVIKTRCLNDVLVLLMPTGITLKSSIRWTVTLKTANGMCEKTMNILNYATESSHPTPEGRLTAQRSFRSTAALIRFLCTFIPSCTRYPFCFGPSLAFGHV